MRHFAITALFLLAQSLPTMSLANDTPPRFAEPPPPPRTMRVATFNTSLNSDQSGGLIARLRGDDGAARKIAAVIQHQRPDIVLLNEFDYDADAVAAELFQRRYLEVAQDGQEPIRYEFRYLAPVNTGVPSGLDLDHDGRSGGEGRARGNDAWGYGLHPGQYGMLVLSRYRVDAASARSFQRFRWANLPGANPPHDPATGKPWYPPEIWTQLRLSSKSHWDLVIESPLGQVHFLAAHPTPPGFDGPERRNAHRNFDEIKFWAEYLSPGDKPWLCDDQGRCGGLPAGEKFIIAGDYNADPIDGRGLPGAIEQLLKHPRVLPMTPARSEGAASAPQTGVNASHRGPPELDTAAFSERSGNLRVDYVLPSHGFTVTANGVFWPKPDQPGAQWLDATDHHLLWVDLAAE